MNYNMKKTLIFVILCLISICAKAQLNSTNQYVNGIWGSWEKVYNFSATGKLSDLIIFQSYSHPSNYICRLKISDFKIPDRKTVRQHYRSNKRYLYHGVLEWAVPQGDTPIVANFVKSFPCYPEAAIKAGRYYKSNVEVYIYPTKNYPAGNLTFNIYFVGNPGMGIGININ